MPIWYNGSGARTRRPKSEVEDENGATQGLAGSWGANSSLRPTRTLPRTVRSFSRTRIAARQDRLEKETEKRKSEELGKKARAGEERRGNIVISQAISWRNLIGSYIAGNIFPRHLFFETFREAATILSYLSTRICTPATLGPWASGFMGRRGFPFDGFPTLQRLLTRFLGVNCSPWHVDSQSLKKHQIEIFSCVHLKVN